MVFFLSLDLLDEPLLDDFFTFVGEFLLCASPSDEAEEASFSSSNGFSFSSLPKVKFRPKWIWPFLTFLVSIFKLLEELDKKLSLITVETDLKKAQNFLNNLQDFIKLYPDEFDIIKVFEFILITKPIKDGNLDDNLKEDLKLFVEFTNKSNLFMKFQDEIEKDKIEIKLNKIRAEIKKKQ